MNGQTSVGDAVCRQHRFCHLRFRPADKIIVDAPSVEIVAAKTR